MGFIKSKHREADILWKTRIRGIYSTALTKLLLKHEFQIVDPSTALAERFSLPESLEAHDLEISDRPDGQGVQLLGKARALDSLVLLLQAHLEDVIVRPWNVTVHGIYKGFIKHVDSERGSVLIDIGPALGRLQILGEPPLQSQALIVQVQKRRLGTNEPSLSHTITFPNNSAVLLPEPQIKISHRIRDSQSRTRLYELGKELKEEWGLLWRTTASNQPNDILKRQVEQLMMVAQAVKKKAEQVHAPALLWEGSHFIDIEFPALSKQRLDAIRSTITPTIMDHHFYKICGSEISSMVDMAEKLLEKGEKPRKVEETFKRMTEPKFPSEGSTIEIEHVKLDGTLLHLGRGQILTFNPINSTITYHRDLRKGGTYDGLGTTKECGDYAVTETGIGEWWLKTHYYSKDNECKGTYINLNTPLELYPWGIRYVDLEVDIIIKPNGEVRVLDEEKLAKRVEEGLITQSLEKKIDTKLKDLLSLKT